ncbi:hypothetical protein ACJJTC_000386 [Scirpophaga incertulas]
MAQGPADEAMARAWREREPAARVAAARAALQLRPDCAAALLLLAEEDAPTVQEAERAVVCAWRAAEAGWRAAAARGGPGGGPGGGAARRLAAVLAHAKRRAAMCARRLGRLRDAARLFRELARDAPPALAALRPHENLVEVLLEQRAYADVQVDLAAQALVARLEEGGAPPAAWLLYTAALLRARAGPEAAALAALRRAIAYNPHVPEYLLELRALTLPPEHVLRRGASEAVAYAFWHLRHWLLASPAALRLLALAWAEYEAGGGGAAPTPGPECARCADRELLPPQHLARPWRTHWRPRCRLPWPSCGQCDPPGQGRSSVPRRTGDKSVTRRCEPVESGPPAVSGPSEESVVTESGERSREKERHSPFDKLGRVLRRDGSASSIGFRSRSSSQASTVSKAHSQQVSPTRLSSGGEKSLVDPVEGTPLTAWRPLSRPILREEDVGNTSSSSVDVSTCSERGSIRYPTSGVTRPETPRAAKRSRQEGSNSGSPTSGPPLARRGRIRTPSTGQRREPVVVVEKMDLAEFLMRSGDSASGSADPPEVPMGGESRATKTCSRKAHKSGSSHSSRGTDSTSVNVAKDRPYKELGTASESDECEEATTVHHRGEQYVSIRAGLAAGAPSDALKDVLDWEREIVSECDSIINTARKSANLKGTSVKSLKGSATKIKGALANVCDALYPEEIRTLKANNTRLQEDVNRMRKEIEELKVELRVARLRPPTSPSQSPSEVARRVKEDERERNFHASVMASVRNLLDASLDGIRRRLPPEECLRPPLASDRVEKGPSSANVTPAAAVDLSTAPLPRREKVGRRKQTSKSGGPETGEGVSSSLSTAPPAPGQGVSAEPPNSHSKEQEWTIVTSKKKEKAKRRKEQAAGTKQPVTEMPPKKKRGKKTSAKREQSAPPKTPRSLAVMISIRPDAAEKPSFAEQRTGHPTVRFAGGRMNSPKCVRRASEPGEPSLTTVEDDIGRRLFTRFLRTHTALRKPPCRQP